MNKEELIEALSKLEHDQWVSWSKAIAKSENINKERHDRWKKLWCSYEDLSEEDKDKDREWARKVLRIVEKNTKKAKELPVIQVSNITSELDKIASEIQPQNPVIALALDQISDKLENIAKAAK